MSIAGIGSVVGSIGGVASAAKGVAKSILRLTGGSDGSWDTSLQQASYGGIKFGVKSASLSAGRKTTVHEYAFRDEVWVEDMGKRGRRFSITGFLVEDDLIYKGGPVIEQRQQLLLVLETKLDKMQPGLTLVHPSLGKIDYVCCIDCDIIERDDYGACFELRFDFIVSGARKYPSAATSSADQIADGKQKVKDASILDYVNQVASAISKGAAIVQQAIATVVKWYQMANKLVNDVRRFFRSVSNLSGNFGALFGGGNTGYSGSNTKAAPGSTVQSLLATDAASRTAVGAAGAALSSAASNPADGATLSAAASSLAAAVAATGADPADSIRILSTLASFQPDDATTDSPVGQAMATVQRAVGALVRRAALAELASASASYQPSSSADAIAVRNNITSLMADEITRAGDSGDDNTYLALMELRSSVAMDLTTRGAQLASMADFQFNAPMSSLVVAHRLYRDAGREDQLLQQVQPVHPAFLPPTFTALSE